MWCPYGRHARRQAYVGSHRTFMLLRRRLRRRMNIARSLIETLELRTMPNENCQVIVVISWWFAPQASGTAGQGFSTFAGGFFRPGWCDKSDFHPVNSAEEHLRCCCELVRLGYGGIRLRVRRRFRTCHRNELLFFHRQDAVVGSDSRCASSNVPLCFTISRLTFSPPTLLFVMPSLFIVTSSFSFSWQLHKIARGMRGGGCVRQRLRRSTCSEPVLDMLFLCGRLLACVFS